MGMSLVLFIEGHNLGNKLSSSNACRPATSTSSDFTYCSFLLAFCQAFLPNQVSSFLLGK